MTRRGWVLFTAMSVIWGVPYLLIKVAVKHVDPPIIVFGRTALAAVVLLFVAARTGALGPALRHWRPVLLFAAVEMGGPWLLLTDAEKRLPSGLTGLLVACVPLFGAFVAYILGDHTALRPVRLLGIAIGLGGVALLVGGDLGGGAQGIPWSSVVKVMLVCIGYSVGPFVVSRRLADVPSIGVVAVSLAAVATAVSPLAWIARPTHTPPASAWWAILGLAAVCTGLAFVVFFALIAEIGPTRSTVITYVNPAVAVLLGVLLLNEPFTAGIAAGFPLILVGSVLAARHAPPAEPPATEAAVPEAVIGETVACAEPGLAPG